MLQNIGGLLTNSYALNNFILKMKEYLHLLFHLQVWSIIYFCQAFHSREAKQQAHWGNVPTEKPVGLHWNWHLNPTLPAYEAHSQTTKSPPQWFMLGLDCLYAANQNKNIYLGTGRTVCENCRMLQLNLELSAWGCTTWGHLYQFTFCRRCSTCKYLSRYQ